MPRERAPASHGATLRNTSGERLERELLSLARRARDRAYAPYSRFPTGAAIRAASGRVYLGCNVENSAFAVVMCAERAAAFAAVAAGETAFSHIALVADAPTPLTPCGACRQVLAELAPDLKLVMANIAGEVEKTTIDALLPFASAPPVGRNRRPK